MRVILSSNPYRDRGLKAAQEAKKILDRENIETVMCLPFTPRKGERVETLMKITEILKVSADNLLRTDIPEVSAIYAGDLDELLKDCTAEEVESLLTMLRQMKTALIKARPSDN